MLFCDCGWWLLIAFYSDITALAKDKAYAHINLSEMTIHQVTIVSSDI